MITVVGVAGAEIAPSSLPAVKDADVLVGSERLLAAASGAARPGVPTVTIGGDLSPVLDAVEAAHRAGDQVCVLAAGDPGLFGVVRSLAARFGSAALRVLPASSSVGVAFARLGLPWDDAAVVSAHGRPLADAARLAARSPKVAVLTAPDPPPEALGRALVDLGASHEHAAVCSRLGLADESVSRTDIAGLAAGTWDPLSVVVLWSGTGVAPRKGSGWGLPESAFDHRASMVTKSEVRAVVLGLLALPPPSLPPPVVWDIGAGSGSVIVECARMAPWIEAIAIERDLAATATCRANAAAHGVALRVVSASAPGCLESLPDPDRVFVGGGGIDALRAAHRRLRPGGIVVATYAAIDRAAVAADLLGNLTQIAASRGRQLPDGGWRLEAANPVFVTWGTAP